MGFIPDLRPICLYLITRSTNYLEILGSALKRFFLVFSSSDCRGKNMARTILTDELWEKSTLCFHLNQNTGETI